MPQHNLVKCTTPPHDARFTPQELRDIITENLCLRHEDSTHFLVVEDNYTRTRVSNL